MGFIAGLAAFAPVPALCAAEMEADVLARPIARGEILGAEDFTRKGVTTAAARFALRAEDAAGKEARRALPAGLTLRASDIGPPTLIHRGDAITLMLRTGRLTITAPGRALADGGAGAAIRVANLANDRTLDARVVAAGSAEVSAP